MKNKEPMKKPKKKMKKRYKALIITGSVIAAIGLTFGGFWIGLKIARRNRTNDDAHHVEPIVGNSLVFARNRSLYDKNGDILRLRGVNAGNILVTEGWIAPYSCGAKTNPDGSLVTDKDGNVEYPDLTEEEVYAAMNNNPNLTQEQKDELTEVYRKNWFSEDDFRRIKEDFHMNAIRLPFYWRNILNENDGVYTRKPEQEAFGYLDWFMEQCQKYEVYCILDLHGTPRTQNGYEHSGCKDAPQLWYDEPAIAATCDLWAYVAEHYLNNPLGEIIATYDIMNEPCVGYADNRSTEEICYGVFNRVYKAIRGTGDNHVITIEGCWTYASFADPAEWGWENIQYEIHLYNWDWIGLSTETYYDGLEFTRIGHDYNVPYFVGEFTHFNEDYAFWEKWLGYYDQIGYSWTLWTYKKTVVGWWNDNWGLVNYRLYLNNRTHEQKVDLRTADYGSLKAVFECSNTTNCYVSTVGKIVAEYLLKH